MTGNCVLRLLWSQCFNLVSGRSRAPSNVALTSTRFLYEYTGFHNFNQTMLAHRIRKPLERTPLGLPKWRLPNLEDKDWLMFEKHVLSQGYAQCTVCDGIQTRKTKMWTCKKCGDERAIRAIYCVREALCFSIPGILVSRIDFVLFVCRAANVKKQIGRTTSWFAERITRDRNK
jgi:hypothetical protein